MVKPNGELALKPPSEGLFPKQTTFDWKTTCAPGVYTLKHAKADGTSLKWTVRWNGGNATFEPRLEKTNPFAATCATSDKAPTTVPKAKKRPRVASPIIDLTTDSDANGEEAAPQPRPDDADLMDCTDPKDTADPMDPMDPTDTADPNISDIDAGDNNPAALKKHKVGVTSTPHFVDLTLDLDLPWVLFAHQKEGCKFITNHQHMGGCILGDEMGLGKTLQALLPCFTRALPSDTSHPNKGNLIVVPVAVLNQWIAEIERFFPKAPINVIKYHGSNRRKTFDLDKLGPNDIVLTTLGTLASDILTPIKSSGKSRSKKWLKNEFEQLKNKGVRVVQTKHKVYKVDDNSPLIKNTWLRVILDEAHTIRNKGTKNHKATSLIVKQCGLCITGTPIVNRVHDALPLLEFIGVDLSNVYEDLKLDESFTGAATSTAARDKVAAEIINPFLNRFMIRRTKEEVGHVVETTTNHQDCIMFCDEHKTYQALQSELLGDLQETGAITTQGDVGSDVGAEAAILAAITRLAMGAQHPVLGRKKLERTEILPSGRILRVIAMLDEQLTDTTQGEIVKEIYCQFATYRASTYRKMLRELNDKLTKAKAAEAKEDRIKNIKDNVEKVTEKKAQAMDDLEWCNSADYNFGSAAKTVNKIREAVEASSAKITNIIDYIKNKLPAGEKVIVFSQWTGFINILDYHLVKQGFQDCPRITGEVTGKDRKDNIDAFFNDKGKCVMLASLKAGGVGLNLQAANHVIFADQGWNPATMYQALCRSARIGQKRHVHVTHMVTQHAAKTNEINDKGMSIDRLKLSLQKKKETHYDAAYATKVDDVHSLLFEDLKLLFSLFEV